MIEKVNPCHPDKIADRIAGAIVDLAYKKSESPKVACEVLIGHGYCHIINETSEHLTQEERDGIVFRIAGEMTVDYKEYKQDKNLAQNQSGGVKCGDNGIFKGCPLTSEEKTLTEIAKDIYKHYPTDGKYILNTNELIICQSNVKSEELFMRYPRATINPLGDWTGGTNVDTGATNRKLGSDMGRSVTGGGLHGKDLSKADVSINVFLHLLAEGLLPFNDDEITGTEYECCCAIGDSFVKITKRHNTFYAYDKNFAYSFIVKKAEEYIKSIGGFEKFAEWGMF